MKSTNKRIEKDKFQLTLTARIDLEETKEEKIELKVKLDNLF